MFKVGDPVYPFLPSTSKGYSQFYAVMADFELASEHNGTFYGLASQYFQIPVTWDTVSGLRASEKLTIQDALDHGYAAIRWYKAYGKDIFLQIAQGCWDVANQVTISPETISSEIMMGRGSSSWVSCQDIEGATSRNAPIGGLLGFYETALFSLLSALLAETEPSNNTYIHAATLSLDFIFSQAAKFNFTLNPLFIRPGGQNCEETLLSNGGTSGFGAMIEAMSIMCSVTGNETIGERLRQVIASTLYSLGGGSNLSPQGVLFNKNVTHNVTTGGTMFGDDGDMYFLRGLAEAYRQSSKGTLPTNLRRNMQILLGVHYNAILNYATSGDNTYSRNWMGPRPTQTIFDLYNQAAAAQILVDGISLFRSSPPKRSTAAIAGGTIGSVVLLLSAILTVLYTIRRWRRRNQTAPSESEYPTQGVVEPFITTTFEKLTNFPHKHPALESQARVVVPEPRLEPLRRRESALSEAADLSGERSGAIGLPTLGANASFDVGRRQEHHHTEGEVELVPTFPDMVREVYHYLWARDGLGNPPDYRSDAGEPPSQS
ncbi:hypothetical protein PM082_014403 [Marasmius tenuissimus]|nr:hypothetical protein PM082_014403 [Marasmius tenuissimus]